MSLLDHPKAKALLADAEVSADAVRSCHLVLQTFLQRYLPRFYRVEQQVLAEIVLQGKLSNLQRKTSEPIAYQAGRQRKPVQHFVGAGCWDDESVMAELREHVAVAMGDPEAVLVLDPSSFPKSGYESCGVARQWCGRLGKVDNCQVGVFLAYISARGQALVDRRLYLPEDWAQDSVRRHKTHVPETVQFQERWRIGLDLLDRSGAVLPFGWIGGDDEFGRCTAFRAELRQRRWKYVLDVPCNTQIRDLGETVAEGHRRPPWRRVDEWARAQPAGQWRKVHLGAGSKGPKVVWALEGWVQVKDEDGRVGGRERVVVIRTLDREPQSWYTLSNASAEIALPKLVHVHSRRHGVEELFAVGKGEVGLNHYEVRSWVGWHHHMTLTLLAVWFLQLDRNRLGGKNPGHHRAADAGDFRPFIAEEPAQRGTYCQGNQQGAAAERRDAHLPLVCEKA
jgi:SRSO17 transposase